MRTPFRKLIKVALYSGVIFLFSVVTAATPVMATQRERTRQDLNTLQERESSHIPMFDIDPRYIPQELRPPSYMQRLGIQRNITDEIRIDNIRIDWFNNRLELFISGFMGDPYFIRVSQDLPRGGSVLIPNTDVRRPIEGELIIFGSHAPMIFPNLALEQGRYYTFTIFDNHNVPQDSFRFRSPYNFDPNEYILETLVDIYGEGKDKKEENEKEEEIELAKTNDPLALMTVTITLMISASFIYVMTLPRTRRKLT
jgi:hypothetical protein